MDAKGKTGNIAQALQCAITCFGEFPTHVQVAAIYGQCKNSAV